jgi:hypothetical protein
VASHRGFKFPRRVLTDRRMLLKQFAAVPFVRAVRTPWRPFVANEREPFRRVRPADPARPNAAEWAFGVGEVTAGGLPVISD